MTKARHVTVDMYGRVWEITDMFDRFGHNTKDPGIAESCVVLWDNNARPASVEDIPIYTVH